MNLRLRWRTFIREASRGRVRSRCYGILFGSVDALAGERTVPRTILGFPRRAVLRIESFLRQSSMCAFAPRAAFPVDQGLLSPPGLAIPISTVRLRNIRESVVVDSATLI